MCAGGGAGEGKCIRVLVGQAVGRSPLGRPGRRWEDIANVDVKVIGSGDVQWVDVPEDRSNR